MPLNLLTAALLVTQKTNRQMEAADVLKSADKQPETLSRRHMQLCQVHRWLVGKRGNPFPSRRHSVLRRVAKGSKGSQSASTVVVLGNLVQRDVYHIYNYKFLYLCLQLLTAVQKWGFKSMVLCVVTSFPLR